MKIVALQASPRKGGNCDVLIDEMIKGIEENGGEVVKYYFFLFVLICFQNPH